MTKETIYTLDYNEFDALVEKTFGVKKYESIANEGWNNYSNYKFTINEERPLGKFDAEKLDEFIKGDGDKCWMARTLFQEMVNRGVLDFGTYMVEVIW